MEKSELKAEALKAASGSASGGGAACPGGGLRAADTCAGGANRVRCRGSDAGPSAGAA